MHRSRFVLPYRDAGDGEHVLYSVLNDRYVGVDDATLQAIERWESGEPPRDADETTVADILLEGGFLTVSREMDDERLRVHLERVREGIPDTLYVILMPTLACNIACTYCFQKDSPSFDRMGPEVESATVGWILERLEASERRRLAVHYFGGEPLTRKDYVLRTAQAFSAAMAHCGGEFEWEMTTNGVHLDLPFVMEMKAYGEGSIKVTLDGDRETHDQARVYRDGRGTFDIVFANLQAVVGHVRLRVGGNFLPGQAASYERLLRRLEEANLLDKLEGVRFKPVLDASRSNSSSCTGCSGTPQLTETLVQINQSVQKRQDAGVLTETEGKNSPCELHWSNSYTIDPAGKVYKCPAVAGRPEMAITDVLSGEPQKTAPLLRYKPWEQCGDCAYLPVCMGGCLGAQYLATGRLDLVQCNKAQFDLTYETNVLRRYQQEMAGREWETPGAVWS